MRQGCSAAPLPLETVCGREEERRYVNAIRFATTGFSSILQPRWSCSSRRDPSVLTSRVGEVRDLFRGVGNTILLGTDPRGASTCVKTPASACQVSERFNSRFFPAVVPRIQSSQRQSNSSKLMKVSPLGPRNMRGTNPIGSEIMKL